MKPAPSFDELRKPLPPLSAMNLYYSTLRFLIRTAGNLSDGIRIGNTFGHDSGLMLDYVYKNQAGGRLLIGKLLDRLYLNAVGWRGIRLRKVLVKEYIAQALQAQLAAKSKVRYLDIACGGGEYDIEGLKDFEPSRLEIELRDYKQENLDKARQNALRHGFAEVRFRQADAFNAANYTGRWDIIVSSGFWEIIDDDALVKGCLLDCARCLDPGSVLLFTIQPHHPQLELIARTLTSNTGKPWIMRLRSLELYQSWMREANLRYVSHELERHGIFGVVQAVKQ
jgi:2-polyprenyl-3-methyl-5-hydroxy-6-metoxy-1,4-benzoquinol methylase